MDVFWNEDSGRQHRLHLRTKEEMRQALHHRRNLPSLMILMFLFVQGPVDLLINLVDLTLNHKIRQIRQKPGHPPGLRPAPLPAGGERTRSVDQTRERPRSPLPDPQLIHIPMSGGVDDQPPQTGRQRQRSRSRERSHPHAQVPQEPQVQPMIIREPVTDPDEDPSVVNPSSSTGISLPVEQRDRSRRQQRSRSRERTPQRTPSHTPSQSGQQPQHVVLPPGEPQTQPLASEDADEEFRHCGTTEPQK